MLSPFVWCLVDSRKWIFFGIGLSFGVTWCPRKPAEEMVSFVVNFELLLVMKSEWMPSIQGLVALIKGL